MKYKLTLAYDGTGYLGWQSQPSGRGVQDHLERALARVLGPGLPRVESASRTDTGVHARAMTLHVEVPQPDGRMTARRLPLALNACLPEDIRVTAASRVAADFHARHDATGKEYRYHLWNAPVMDPLRRHRAWHVARPLDLAAMREAAARLPGRRDFRAFTVNRGTVLEDAVRTLHRCEVRRRGREVVIMMEGSGFLYRMCRAIAGTLVQVGEGKLLPGVVEDIVEGRDRRLAGATAPACGLVLWRVRYTPIR